MHPQSLAEWTDRGINRGISDVGSIYWLNGTSFVFFSPVANVSGGDPVAERGGGRGKSRLKKAIKKTKIFSPRMENKWNCEVVLFIEWEEEDI